MTRPAVVLLSGGLDSATVAAIAQRDGFAVHALSVAYGQRHDIELEASARVAARLLTALAASSAMASTPFGATRLHGAERLQTRDPREAP